MLSPAGFDDPREENILLTIQKYIIKWIEIPSAKVVFPEEKNFSFLKCVALGKKKALVGSLRWKVTTFNMYTTVLE